MIESFQELFTTEQSHPFLSAVDRCGLEQAGYREREFLFSGTANIYGLNAKGSAAVLYPDCPYTSRLMLRQPKNPADFSGRVVVEIVNSTANFDIERVWAESYRLLMRDGDVYLGVTSKANVFPALKRFDPQRYGTLNWPNPFSEPAPDWDEPPLWTGPKDQEIGYIWDILRELPLYLRGASEDNPLQGWGIRFFYLTAWSQSCSYLNRFVQLFESECEHGYSGYLSAGGIRKLATPLNRYEDIRTMDLTKIRLNQTPAPLIELNTESECSDEHGLSGYSARRDDSDDPAFPYRYLDIAGGCHDAKDTWTDYLGFDEDVSRAMSEARLSLPSGTTPNGYPKYFAFHVALHDLFVWAEQRIAPRHRPRMLQTANGKLRKDAFGNSLGGLRSPLVDLPTCVFHSWTEISNPITEEKTLNVLAGHEKNFSAAFLHELYGSVEQYRKLVIEDVERLCSEGYVLGEDAPDLIETAVRRAENAGLH